MLGSRVYAQHVCLWHPWRRRTPCYLISVWCWTLIYYICASLRAMQGVSNILSSAGSFRCNNDLCYSIFHLKLCVLAVRSGTSTNAQGLALYLKWGHYIANHYTPKIPKPCNFHLFPARFTNQYLQLLVGSTTFSYLKGTTIDLLHLGVIKILFRRHCRGASCYW